MCVCLSVCACVCVCVCTGALIVCVDMCVDACTFACAYMDTYDHLDITFTMHNYAFLLNIYLVTEIYNKRDVLKIPCRNKPSLTIAPGEYSYTVFVYPDRMTCVMYKSRILYCTHVMTFRSIYGYIYY